MKSRLFALAAVPLLLLLGVASAEGAIIGISTPVNSDDATSHPRTDGVWSVEAPPYPLDVTTGIGNIIGPWAGPPSLPQEASDFSRHDHRYSASYVPDPTRAVVTYEFDAPTMVDQLEIIQHRNGITRVEGLVGDSLASLVSIGSIFGPLGDVTTPIGDPPDGEFANGDTHVFDFNNAVSGKFFQFIVRKTSFYNGWATYRALPRLSDGTRIAAATAAPDVPEPFTLILMGLGLAGIGLSRRRAH